MSGYRIFKGNGNQDVKNKLSEIGITYDGSNSYTFSDGTTVSGQTYVIDTNWVIADDDAHFIYVAPSDINNAAFKSTTSADNRPGRVIAELIDGSVQFFKDSDSQSAIHERLNTSCLTTTDGVNNDTSATDLTITQLVGDFDGHVNKYVFKSLYVNYKRWFQFGDVITTSNGDQYIGIGWILHKIGG